MSWNKNEVYGVTIFKTILIQIPKFLEIFFNPNLKFFKIKFPF